MDLRLFHCPFLRISFSFFLCWFPSLRFSWLFCCFSFFLFFLSFFLAFWRKSRETAYILHGNIVFQILNTIIIPLLSLSSIESVLEVIHSTPHLAFSLYLQLPVFPGLSCFPSSLQPTSAFSLACLLSLPSSLSSFASPVFLPYSVCIFICTCKTDGLSPFSFFSLSIWRLFFLSFFFCAVCDSSSSSILCYSSASLCCRSSSLFPVRIHTCPGDMSI